MELSVGELAQILGQSQPRVSRHLKILSDARVLERRKEGSWVFLTLADPDRVEPMFALIDAWSDKSTQTLFASDCARTEGIRSERAEAATRYFSGHAEVWDQIRSLHAAETEVESAIDEALGNQHLGRLVDIGTELFAITASCSRAQAMLNQSGKSPEILEVVDYFCDSAKLRIAHLFRDLHHNTDRDGYRLAQQVLEGKQDDLMKGVLRQKP